MLEAWNVGGAAICIIFIRIPTS